MTHPQPTAGDFAQAITSPNWPQCEELIKQFEDAWQLGQPPSISSFLLDNSDVRPALLVELIHVDMEFRFKLGLGARVEDYLALYPELTEDAMVVVDLLATEYRLRRWKQEHVQLVDVARRFPQHRPAILARLSMEVQETQAASPKRARLAP